MTVTIRCQDGSEYEGRSVESIVRRVWGRSAEIKWDHGRNLGEDVKEASIVKRVRADEAQWRVLDRVIIRF